MKPIICNKQDILTQLRQFLEKEDAIVDLFVVDEQKEQVVLLIDSKQKITSEFARVWWQGYQAGMGLI